MVEISKDKTLSPEQKVALVIYELRLLNALPEIPFLLGASWPFPVLNSNDIYWLENKRKAGETDWPWFESAIKFLNGEGVLHSDFESVKAKFLQQLNRQIDECRRISNTKSKVNISANEQRKQIGGHGSAVGNVIGISPSIWDKVDFDAWREQK